jgi:hypothetical protein
MQLIRETYGNKTAESTQKIAAKNKRCAEKNRQNKRTEILFYFWVIFFAKFRTVTQLSE